jgi:hypothetical protein
MASVVYWRLRELQQQAFRKWAADELEGRLQPSGGKIARDRLKGLPHPSGANAERIA